MSSSRTASGIAYGGAGSGVLEYLARKQLCNPVLQLGLPDEFIKHGSPQEILAELQLDSPGVLAQINTFMAQHQR